MRLKSPKSWLSRVKKNAERVRIFISGGKMKLKLLSLSIGFIFLLSCVSVDREQVKIYVSGLEPMIDKGSEDVLSKVEDTWGFLCSKFWTTENPTLKDVFKEIKGRTAFTEQEASQIFSPEGKYKVMIFFKLLGTESVSTGTISSKGTTYAHTAGKKYEDKRYANIRLVFRGDKLVHFRVWPNL